MVKRKGRGRQKRKKARISALGGLKKANRQKTNNNNASTSASSQQQQQQTQEVADVQHNGKPPSPPPSRPPSPPPPPPGVEASSSQQPPPERKRGRKRKRLNEVAVASVGPTTQQNGENPEHEVPPVNNGVLPSTQQLPEKRILEFVLDILQRRDTHEIFAQPVDGNEVEGYYSIIQNPMDFGTMRAKLQEGMYTTFEQFESDIFLISNNAMLFNSSATIYFRQARAIHELAKRVFTSLKSDPKRIELEFSLSRRRGRKSQGETGGSHTKLDAKLPVFRDGENVNLCEIERRQTYRPETSEFNKESILSTFCSSSKQLVPGNGGIGYKESLLRFVKDLGPTAQKVANQRARYLTPTPSHSVRASCHLISSPASQQRLRCMEGVINGVTADANNPLASHGATYKGKNILTNESIDFNNSACGGNMALGVGRLDIQGAASKGKNVIMDDNMDPYAAAYKGKNVITGDSMDPYCGACGGKAALFGRVGFQSALSGTTGIRNALPWESAGGTDRTLNDMAAVIGPSRGKFLSSEKRDLLAQLLGENSAQQSERTKGWLGLEFPTAQNEGLNSTGANFKYMDLLQGAIEGDISHCSQNAQNDLFSYLPNAGTANIYGRSTGMTDSFSKYNTADRMLGTRQLVDQMQPTQSVSRSQSVLLELLSRCNRHPKSYVYPSKVVKPSGSIEESNAPLNLNYGASSAQVTQPLEWSQPTPWDPQAIYDFQQVQPQFGDLNPLGPSAPYMQVQPSGMNSLDQDAVLQQELQLALAQSMQPQQPTDGNIFGQEALSQLGLQIMPAPCVQPQPSLLNLLGQEAFVVQPEPQLPMVSYMQPLTNKVNPLGQDAYVQQGLPLGLSQFVESQVSDAQPLLGFPDQGLMSVAGNFCERAPLQDHQSNSNPQLWNFEEQSLRGTQHPDLDLGLQTQNWKS